MPSHYGEEEYYGNEDAMQDRTTYKKKKTKGQKLKESGQYLKDPETEEPTDIQVNYADLTNPNAGEEGEQFTAYPGLTQGINQNILQEGGKWGAAALGTGLTALQKFGEGVDWVGDHILGIPGTDIDLYHARRVIIDPLEKQGFALGLLGEILLPDALDVATLGLSYIPSKFLKAGKAGIKLWAKAIKQTGKFNASQLDELRAAGKFDEADALVRSTFGKKTKAQPYAYASDDIPIDETDSTIDAVIKGIEDARKGDDVPDAKVQKLFDKYGLKDEMSLFWKEWEGGFKLAEDKRNFMAALEDSGFSVASFTKTKRELLPQILEEFAAAKKLDPSLRFHLHHINALKSSLPMFEGMRAAERAEMLKIIMKEGLFAGHNPKNLQFLPEPVHQEIHSYLSKHLGKFGQKFFDKRGLQDLSYNEKLQKVRDYAKIIKESQRRAYSALAGFKDATTADLAGLVTKRLDAVFNQANFEELILTGETLPGYISPEVNRIFKPKPSRIPKKITKIDPNKEP